MKSLLFWTVALLTVSLTRGQKGGAKGAMRNRGGKGGGTFGGGGGRNIEDEWDVSTILQHYDYSKPRPCVGLCFIMKLRGGPKPVYPKHPPEEREACVGMCHRDKEEGVTRRRWRQVRKTKRKPCVGMCHRNKQKKRRLEHEERKRRLEHEEMKMKMNMGMKMKGLNSKKKKGQ